MGTDEGRRWRGVSAAALVVLAAACTTAPPPPSPTAATPPGPSSQHAAIEHAGSPAAADPTAPVDLDTPAPPPASTEPRAPDLPTATVEAAVEPPADDGTEPPAVAASASCPVPVAPGVPGITDDEVLVGAPRVKGGAAALASVGFDPPNHELDEYVDAYVEHLNATGGLACRQARIVWHDLDVAEGGSFGTVNEQAMCATWTQDHQVFVAVPAVDGPGEVLYPCLDRAGVTIIDVMGWSIRDRQGFDEVPYLLAPNSPRLDRGVAAQVHALVRQGFLDEDARIGLVHYDDVVTTRTVDETLVPALSSHELTLAQRRAVSTPRGRADLPARDRELANVALRFRRDDVDRVLFVGGDGLAAGFMRVAEANRYRPLYGLNSIQLPVAGIADVPARQLVGAQGIGWVPDLDGWHHPPGDSWPARTACLEFFHAHGFEVTTTLDRHWALQVCEAVGFLDATLDAAPRPLAPDAILAGARALGTSWESPMVGSSQFGPDQRDGATTYRDVAYDDTCGCFLHAGPDRSLDGR